MKITALLTLILALSGCWMRIGDLTMISTRNVDSKTDYELLQRYSVGKGKKKKGRDPLDQAVDKAVRGIPGGEFLKNIKIYVKQGGRKIKVEGDVWGIPPKAPADPND